MATPDRNMASGELTPGLSHSVSVTRRALPIYSRLQISLSLITGAGGGGYGSDKLQSRDFLTFLARTPYTTKSRKILKTCQGQEEPLHTWLDLMRH